MQPDINKDPKMRSMVNAHGNFNIHADVLIPGFVLLGGKEYTRAAKKLGVPYIPAITWGDPHKGKVSPRAYGVVVAKGHYQAVVGQAFDTAEVKRTKELEQRVKNIEQLESQLEEIEARWPELVQNERRELGQRRAALKRSLEQAYSAKQKLALIKE